MEEDKTKLITDEDLDFLSKWTRESSFESLRAHVLSLLDLFKSQKHHIYVCIDRMMFLKPRLPRHFYYKQFLDQMKSNDKNTIADLGCCFGQEVRNLIFEGISPRNIFAIDLCDDYWNVGREVFMDNVKDSALKLQGVTTVFGDFAQKFPLSEEVSNRIADSFKEHFSGVVCQMIFHVLSQEETENFVKRMFAMTKNGGIIIGSCLGTSEEPTSWAPTPKGDGLRFLHSVKSLGELFKTAGFFEYEVIENKLNTEGKSKSTVAPKMPEDKKDVKKCRLEFFARKK